MAVKLGQKRACNCQKLEPDQYAVVQKWTSHGRLSNIQNRFSVCLPLSLMVIGLPAQVRQLCQVGATLRQPNEAAWVNARGRRLTAGANLTSQVRTGLLEGNIWTKQRDCTDWS